MYKSGDIHTHTHVETTSFVLGLLKKRNQGFMLGSTFVLKNSACCKMAVKASTPQTLQSLWRRNSTSSNQGPRECKTLVKKNNSQGAHMHTAILTPKTWPRHPRRKSTCLKRCSKEPEKKKRKALNKQLHWPSKWVDTTTRLQNRKAPAHKHMPEVTLNRDKGLIQMVHASVHTHMTHEITSVDTSHSDSISSR